MDRSSELTAVAEVQDVDEAVRQLADGMPDSGLPGGAVIAIRQESSNTVQWPPERRGEEVV
jgi:hypothetical protein